MIAATAVPLRDTGCPKPFADFLRLLTGRLARMIEKEYR
jgi:hypothetical protein